MPRHIQSKWAKTIALLSSPSLRGYIPITKRMNAASMKQMLHQYSMVYIKPNQGTFGNGVMRVEWSGASKGKPYQYQSGLRIRRFSRFESMYASILRETRRRHYLVQKGIHLLKYRGNRFDIRVMVQQSPKRRWEATGMIGRVAHPGKVVTNFHSGGKLQPVEQLLGNYLLPKRKLRYMGRLKSLGLEAAHVMGARFRGVKEIGLDVAVDARLKPWILEVNTRPDPFIFRRLKDKRIFAKVIRYAKAYGRL